MEVQSNKIPSYLEETLLTWTEKKEVQTEKKNHTKKGFDYENKHNCHLPVSLHFYKTSSTGQSSPDISCVLHIFFPQ